MRLRSAWGLLLVLAPLVCQISVCNASKLGDERLSPQELVGDTSDDALSLSQIQEHEDAVGVQPLEESSVGAAVATSDGSRQVNLPPTPSAHMSGLPGVQSQNQVDTLLQKTEEKEASLLRMSAQEQKLLEARERTLEVQLAHVREEALAQADSGVNHQRHSLGRDAFVPKTLDENKMSTSNKVFLSIAFAAVLLIVLTSAYRMSRNFSKKLSVYIGNKDRAKAWKTSKRRAMVLFSWWPDIPPSRNNSMVWDIASPCPPAFPHYEPSCWEICQHRMKSWDCSTGQIDPHDGPILEEGVRQTRSGKDAHNMWVNIFHSRLYDNEKDFLRAYSFKENADALNFMELVTKALLVVLIPLQGSFDSPFVDTLIKVTMMILAVCGTVLTGAMQAFKPHQLAEQWLSVAEYEAELIYDLANLSDEFSVKEHWQGGTALVSKEVFVDMFSLYLKMSSEKRTELFDARRGRSKKGGTADFHKKEKVSKSDGKEFVTDGARAMDDVSASSSHHMKSEKRSGTSAWGC